MITYFIEWYLPMAAIYFVLAMVFDVNNNNKRKTPRQKFFLTLLTSIFWLPIMIAMPVGLIIVFILSLVTNEY